MWSGVGGAYYENMLHEALDETLLLGRGICLYKVVKVHRIIMKVVVQRHCISYWTNQCSPTRGDQVCDRAGSVALGMPWFIQGGCCIHSLEGSPLYHFWQSVRLAILSCRHDGALRKGTAVVWCCRQGARVNRLPPTEEVQEETQRLAWPGQALSVLTQTQGLEQVPPSCAAAT